MTTVVAGEALPLVLTCDQVAGHLGCCVRTVRRMIRRGTLAGYVLNPKARMPQYRVPREALEAYLGAGLGVWKER